MYLYEAIAGIVLVIDNLEIAIFEDTLTLTFHQERQMLGGYSFQWNPDRWSDPRAIRLTGGQKTFASFIFLSWGLTNSNPVIVLEWDWMQMDDWNAIKALYESDTSQTWSPGDGNSYMVQILAFDGRLVDVSGFNAQRRENVKLTLAVLRKL